VPSIRALALKELRNIHRVATPLIILELGYRTIVAFRSEAVKKSLEFRL
jgi:hypothetical protein